MHKTNTHTFHTAVIQHKMIWVSPQFPLRIFNNLICLTLYAATEYSGDNGKPKKNCKWMVYTSSELNCK